jgi:hypothetical protein
VTIEPGLELGWWSALRARTAMQQYDRAVEALDELDRTFGYTLGPEAFETDPSMSDLLLSDDYEAWYDSRRQPEAGQADEDETD